MESRVFLDSFTLAWEQRKVQDVADRFDNLRIPVAANLRVHGTTPYYGANGIQDYVEGFTHDGEFVLVAEDGANDLKNYPVKCVTGRIWVNNHAHVLQGKAGIADNSFLAFAISQSDIESLLVGGGRAKLNAETLMSIEFRLPCLQEQYRIGEYLTQLDHLITLHQCKESAFSEWKDSGFLQKHKTTWEQRKLDTITDVRDGTHDSPQYVELGHPFITSKNVKDGFINYEDIQYVSDKDYEEINKRSKVDKNDILMGMIGTIGNIALVRETPDFAIKNVALIKDIGDVYYRYLYHCLQSNSIAHQLDENLDGGTQKFIALNKIRELVIPVPSDHEQQKIGDYMESLDNLITLHQRKPFCINRRQKWKQTTKMQNYSANIMQNGFQYIRKGR